MISRYYAVKELLENGISSLPITTEQLEAIINAKGFKIINYDTRCKIHTEILNDFDVLPIAKRTKAFTYVRKNEKIVFVKIGISANEKRLLLAHELGHISLNHISDSAVIDYRPGGLIDEAQEDEANAFALELLAPVCILHFVHVNTPQKISTLTLLDEKRSRLVADEVKNYKKSTNVEIELYKQFEASIKPKKTRIDKIIVCAGMFLLSCIIMLSCICASTPIDNAMQKNTTESHVETDFYEMNKNYDYVVVTKSGEKYHTPDCTHIKSKINIIKMTEQEALDVGYEPCLICKPEK